MITDQDVCVDHTAKPDRRLRIALVAPEVFPLPPREGFATAVEFLIHEMGEVLARRHDVTTYSIAASSNAATSNAASRLADGQVGDIDYRYTPVTSLDKKILPFLYRVGRRVRGGDLQYWQSTGYFGSYALRTALKIRRGKFDIVHLFNILQFAPWIRRLAPESKLVFHITWHGLSKTGDYYGYSVLKDQLARRCLRDVDAVVTCSDYLLDGIRKRFPDYANKVVRVYNGVKAGVGDGTSAPSGGLERQNQELVVIFAGRIVPEKGLHTLLKAMRTVADWLPQAKLQVVGVSWRPGAEFSAYERELQLLAQGLEPRIEFLGWKSRAEFPEVLAQGDVYAFPSLWEEPFSMALLEAMAAGLPVVATATGGTPEIIQDGENGYLVPPDDPDALADRLLALLLNPDVRRRQGERGHSLVQERYRWESIVSDLEAVYRQALKGWDEGNRRGKEA